MADSDHSTTSTVIALPGAGPYAGKRSHRDKLEQRRDREILLALIEGTTSGSPSTKRRLLRATRALASCWPICGNLMATAAANGRWIGPRWWGSA
jgi:hypothetical protein